MAFIATETELRLPGELKRADGLDVCWVVALGRRSYHETMQLQSYVVACRKLDQVPDCLLLVEHPHTITLGSAGDPGHLLVPKKELEKRGVDFQAADRGGDITYHGPGQLVAYPIMDLKCQQRDIGHYLRRLEVSAINTLEMFGIRSGRVAGATGVWVGDKKIAAIGVRTSQWVTSHGLALNVNTDLSYFQFIVPCGIRFRGVTSMREVIGTRVEILLATQRFCACFGGVFSRNLQALPEVEAFPGYKI
jgi:lipoyl(octanoyl) transferase